MEFVNVISQKLNIKPNQVEVVIELLNEGATIPFIARYRKDSTGNLDEVQIMQIQDELKYQKEFFERKQFIIKTISDQEKMTDDLLKKINQCILLNELEDIYLPFKPKRKTKAQTAKENGLEPLADLILKEYDLEYEIEAQKYLNEKIITTFDALQGARDIIAEIINENIEVRNKLRKLFENNAKIYSKVLSAKQNEAIKFKDYFDFSELISKIPSHRTLAILRGFLEGFLKVNIEPDENEAIEIIEPFFTSKQTAAFPHLQKAIKDAYKRLLQPALETEYRTNLKQAADEEAIQVFSENLRQLLLSAPLGNKRIMAIDPGYRTGCKLVCLDENGVLLFNDVIYIHEENRKLASINTIQHCIDLYKIETIAVGDGTAGRETEKFLKENQITLPIFLVNEDGASIYSASEVAREEFPDIDLTVRGAVSIGRRLMDPLAELVKIDPKSIGVGQYQHDVNQSRLKEKLDQTVISCVNKVGVNINTASKHLLSYVSGIGPVLAENIIQYRNENGRFNERKELLKVSRLGDKAFKQAAGFLRITKGKNLLEESAVHPEAYDVVAEIANHLNCNIKDLIGQESLINSISINKFVSNELGVHTLTDILHELKKPGLDPRKEIMLFEFANIYSIDDVKIGEVYPGLVTNITRFGAFVDIGVKQDGLVHISEIANQYISDPSEVLKLNQAVKVKVIEIDVPRKRLALSIKQTEEKKSFDKKNLNKSQPNKKPENFQDALSSLKSKFRN